MTTATALSSTLAGLAGELEACEDDLVRAELVVAVARNARRLDRLVRDLLLAASNDTVVSTPAIEEFAYHLRAGSHLVIAGAKHEILQEQDRYRAQFWAAFDAFVPGTPLFK